MPEFIPTQIRWWYPAIADWMIANPGGDLKDCADSLKRHVNTVRIIARSDVFKEYLAQRRAEWQANHDFAILDRVNRVAERSLDLMLENIEKKGDKIPIAHVTEIALGALDRLGYAPKTNAGPQVNVSVGQQNNVTVAVTTEALLEAQQALREVERQRGIAGRKTLELEVSGSVPDEGRGTDVEVEAERDEVECAAVQSAES